MLMSPCCRYILCLSYWYLLIWAYSLSGRANIDKHVHTVTMVTCLSTFLFHMPHQLTLHQYCYARCDVQYTVQLVCTDYQYLHCLLYRFYSLSAVPHCIINLATLPNLLSMINSFSWCLITWLITLHIIQFSLVGTLRFMISSPNIYHCILSQCARYNVLI